MNFLDMRTVLLGYVASNALCLLVITLLWRRNRRRFAGLGLWLADFAMQFLSMLVIGLRGIVPAGISIVAGNTLLIGGIVFLHAGLERFVGRSGWKPRNLALFVTFMAAQSWFTFGYPSLFARNIVVSLGLFAICVQCAWLMLREADSGQPGDTRAVGIVFALYSFVSLARIGFEIALPPGNELFKSGLYDTLAVLIYQMLSIALTFALFLLVNNRLQMALETDIAKRKLVEESLRLSEEKFSIAFQNIPDSILITSIADGTIIEENEGFARITGYSRDESSGRTTIDLKLWEETRDREWFVKELREHGRVLNYETRFRLKNGTIITGLISGETISINGRECALTVIHDISERKKAEETISALNANLEQRVRERTTQLERGHRLPRILPVFGLARPEDSSQGHQELFGNTGCPAPAIAQRRRQALSGQHRRSQRPTWTASSKIFSTTPASAEPASAANLSP